MTVVLPNLRDVFKGVGEFNLNLKGPEITETQQLIDFVINGKQRILNLQKDPSRFQLDGTVDGKFYPDLYPEGSGWQK
jgi:hypothetical protein